jgi:hypothetical protein
MDGSKAMYFSLSLLVLWGTNACEEEETGKQCCPHLSVENVQLQPAQLIEFDVYVYCFIVRTCMMCILYFVMPYIL